MQKKIILLARERGAGKNVQGKRNVKEARICVRVETRTTPERVVLDQLDQKVNRYLQDVPRFNFNENQRNDNGNNYDSHNHTSGVS
jgi:hypothetical protein